MTDLLAKLAIAMVSKLLTEKFLSKLLVHSLRAWAQQTENSYDDKVVEAMAEALDVPKELLTVSRDGNDPS